MKRPTSRAGPSSMRGYTAGCTAATLPSLFDVDTLLGASAQASIAILRFALHRIKEATLLAFSRIRLVGSLKPPSNVRALTLARRADLLRHLPPDLPSCSCLGCC